MLRLETFGRVLAAPNGSVTAYEIISSFGAAEPGFGRSGRRNARVELFGNRRIRRFPALGGKPHWLVGWNQDSRTLALFVHDEDHVQLRLGDSRTGRIGPPLGRPAPFVRGEPFWNGDDLVFIAGDADSWNIGFDEAWQLDQLVIDQIREVFRSPERASVTVVTNQQSEPLAGDGGRLIRLSKEGREHNLGLDRVLEVIPAPQGNFAAVRRDTGFRETLSKSHVPLRDVRLTELFVVNLVTGEKNKTNAGFALVDSIRWFASGRRLLFSGTISRDLPPRWTWMTFDVLTGRLEPVPFQQLRLTEPQIRMVGEGFTAHVWTADEAIALFTADGVEAMQLATIDPNGVRRDWPFKIGPAAVRPFNGRLFLIANGSVYVSDPDQGFRRSFVPGAEVSFASAPNELPLIRSELAKQAWLYRKDTGGFQPISLTRDEAFQNAAADATQFTTKSMKHGRRTELHAHSVAASQRTLIAELNRWLEGLDFGSATFVTYRLEGFGEQVGWLLRPSSPAVRPLPLVVAVYGGDIHSRNRIPRSIEVTGPANILNYSLFLERGWGVLIPSIPLYPPDAGHNAFPLQMSRAVTACVEAALRAGDLDGNRLAIIGQSFGGYTVHSVLTQSKLFKAAAASAGPTDPYALYGTFHSIFERSSAPLRSPMADFIEAAQFNMQKPPSGNLDLYLANSPVAQAERITTPLLLLHGSHDVVPESEPERMASILMRLDKPVRYVEFEGEGHTPHHPQNIRRYWREVFDWFEYWFEKGERAR